MEMETTDKYCCDCAYYLHGVLENPCAKNMSCVGYLQVGCWRWRKSKDDAADETKICSICGEEKTLDKFTLKKGVPQHYCKACRLEYKARRKRKKKN